MNLLTIITVHEINLDIRLLALMLVVFIAGIIRGYTGFGSALLAVPALAVLYGPVQAVVIEVLIEIPVSLGLLPNAIRKAERSTVLPMLLMFALFVPAGALLLKIANPDYVKLAISIFVLFAVVLLWQQARFTKLISPKANYVVGSISGITQGLTGIAGPLFVTALLARGEDNTKTRANITALAAGIVLFSVLSFWFFDLFTLQLVFIAMLASPAILSGVWMGSALFNRAPNTKFREIILIFLALTAAFVLIETMF